ncbi:hypothetical protein [Dyella psychrodurans]|uniref:Uncharacterized protein n=1 Tax=Dyella psychrodurans TaxID=1927960 RepID=A0A370XCW7_9GAMM|nr:hypothetical protein [Dyella psychrodurans]RDS86293.1 hypothetical protein DWU99_03260 [Dyella psychrodurans]
MPYASNNNAVLIDGCENLQNLSVLLEVTEDIATTNGGGWSLQLNCFPPPGEYCQTSQLNWFQYVIYVEGGNLIYQIQYWSNGTSTWPSGYTPESQTTPWLPCWANDFSNPFTTFASISGDTVPRQSKLQIALTTNDAGGVTSVTFTYTDPNGNDHPAVYKLPVVHPIVACTLNLVGPGGLANANFTQGLTNSRAIIYYSVSSGQLAVQNGGIGAACGEAGPPTGETSNMTYSDINGAPASTVTQILQQPISCAINNLFQGEEVKLGDMRQVRDLHVARYPAGQWLIEVLDRHAADLAMLALSSDISHVRTARHLLTEATRIAREGRIFESATIDEAQKLLQHVSCKLPPSMIGASQAGTTVLESLRGRTLEDGLKAASRTIRPRFLAPSQQPCQKCYERLAQRVAELEKRVKHLESR